MKVTWLGQSGLLFNCDGIRIMVDPYLSDSITQLKPNKLRRIPIDETFLEIRPDILILTHDHLDHTDPDTLGRLLETDRSICVLASENAWKRVRQYGRNHNYVLFNEGTEWTECGIIFKAIYAQHSDEFAVGVSILHDGKTWYVTGDTLYHKRVIQEAPKNADGVFLPINGSGNNLNMADAERLARKLGAKVAIPIHIGLFDDLNPHEWGYKNKLILPIYHEITL